jgi:hypothetical protein
VPVGGLVPGRKHLPMALQLTPRLDHRAEREVGQAPPLGSVERQQGHRANFSIKRERSCQRCLDRAHGLRTGGPSHREMGHDVEIGIPVWDALRPSLMDCVEERQAGSGSRVKPKDAGEAPSPFEPKVEVWRSGRDRFQGIHIGACDLHLREERTEDGDVCRDAAGGARIVPKPPRLDERICLGDEQHEGGVANGLGGRWAAHLTVRRGVSSCRIGWTVVDGVDAESGMGAIFVYT